MGTRWNSISFREGRRTARWFGSPLLTPLRTLFWLEEAYGARCRSSDNVISP